MGNLLSDLSCCIFSQKCHKTASSETDTASDNGNSDNSDQVQLNCEGDSDFSECEIEYLECIDDLFNHEESHENEHNLASQNAFDTVILEFTDTNNEKPILLFKQNVLSNYGKFNDWFVQQESIIDDIGLNSFPEEETKFSQKHRNEFLSSFTNI